ncbi:hypothetical protein PAN31108_02924 [Pandoraea anhela]|uniref:Uncharacterized protein n=1 Tax=Pandoraea anhela TaxID=2508295 RepID=A0A5E4W139_9BURK|nr:hypothetical protein PAN31108_02924 [Pandoraea anhela]
MCVTMPPHPATAWEFVAGDIIARSAAGLANLPRPTHGVPVSG